ncbi:hypothetical protein HT031_000273 [Scenedesmus sp. PABB004]|nr:hypothetical protein HT031_000273 [Scenedesmus sp. PABB004]
MRPGARAAAGGLAALFAAWALGYPATWRLGPGDAAPAAPSFVAADPAAITRFAPHPGIRVLHSAAGGLWAALVPLQLSARARRAAPRLHRAAGLAFFACAAAVSAGYALMERRTGVLRAHGVHRNSFYRPLAAWFAASAAAALAAAARGDGAAHGAWAARHIAVGLTFAVARALVLVAGAALRFDAATALEARLTAFYFASYTAAALSLGGCDARPRRAMASGSDAAPAAAAGGSTMAAAAPASDDRVPSTAAEVVQTFLAHPSAAVPAVAIEWVVHKHLLHSSFEWPGKAIHAAHHAAPYHHVSLDPPWLVLSVMAAAGAAAAGVFSGGPLALTATGAYVTAGLCYEFLHYVVHTRWLPRSAYLRAVRRHHQLHHLRNEDYWLSFTLPAVDRLFGTLPARGSAVPLSDAARAAHGAAGGGRGGRAPAAPAAHSVPPREAAAAAVARRASMALAAAAAGCGAARGTVTAAARRALSQLRALHASAPAGAAAPAVAAADDPLTARCRGALAEMRAGGTYKTEHPITTAQGATIGVEGRDQPVLNFCANNYLGLSNHPDVVAAARAALDSHGFGLSSVRFICGTQDLHKALEARISAFHGTQDTILYPSCFDANAGLFEALLGPDDAIISDELNHASIIDGVRLCKAKRYRFKHMDMADLDAKLTEAAAAGARVKLIATDGVFSMDGDIAPLGDIVSLARRHGAQVMADDCHATGFVGATGRGSDEHAGVPPGQVDIINSTLGKALGGATGGYTTGRADVIALLRQRARPYLFSNTLAPAVAAASVAVFDLLARSTELRDTLADNTAYFRRRMAEEGFSIRPGTHPIVPIMLGDAALASRMAAAMLEKGIYVVGFSYPVVPRGAARIRVQLSAAHERAHLDAAIAAFVERTSVPPPSTAARTGEPQTVAPPHPRAPQHRPGSPTRAPELRHDMEDTPELPPEEAGAAASSSPPSPTAAGSGAAAACPPAGSALEGLAASVGALDATAGQLAALVAAACDTQRECAREQAAPVAEQAPPVAEQAPPEQAPPEQARLVAELEQQLAALAAEKARVEADRQEMAVKQGNYKGTIAQLEGALAFSERKVKDQLAAMDRLQAQVAGLSAELQEARGAAAQTPDRCRTAARALQAEADKAASFARTNEAQVKKLKQIVRLSARELSELLDFAEQERLTLVEKEAALQQDLAQARGRAEAAEAAASGSQAEAEALAQQLEATRAELLDCQAQLAATQEQLEAARGALAEGEARAGVLVGERDAAARNLAKAEAELNDVSEYSTKMFRQVRFISHVLDKNGAMLGKLPDFASLARDLRAFVAANAAAAGATASHSVSHATATAGGASMMADTAVSGSRDVGGRA